MNARAAVRRAISFVVVEPFFEFLAILEIYARLEAGFAAETEARLRRFIGALPAKGFDGDVARLLSDLKLRLKSRQDLEDRDLPPFEPPEEADEITVLECLCDVVKQSAPAGGYVEWALIDPLIIFWRVLSQPDSAATEFAQALKSWLGSTPIPSGYTTLAAHVVEHDLLYLKEVLFATGDVRERIGERLRESLNGESAGCLLAAIARAGYAAAESRS